MRKNIANNIMSMKSKARLVFQKLMILHPLNKPLNVKMGYATMKTAPAETSANPAVTTLARTIEPRQARLPSNPSR